MHGEPAHPGRGPERAPRAGGRRYCVGIVSYQSHGALEQCLESVAHQKAAPDAVYVLDGEAELERHTVLRESYPWAEFEAAPNRGYAGGANRLLARVAAEQPQAEFCLLLNPDVELEPDFTERLIAAIAARPDVALATGKLLRPDGATIDSAGIELPRHRRPRDRGSDQEDRGQHDEAADVFGASGAAMLLRMSALDDLALDGEVFDEDFFVYHEDTDLCWRAHRLGWRVRYEPAARARHARGWRRSERFDVPVFVRRHSFKNHYLQLIKNETGRELVRGLPVLLMWEVLRLGFAVLRDREVLSAYADAGRLTPRAYRKRRLLREKVGERGGLGLRAR